MIVNIVEGQFEVSGNINYYTYEEANVEEVNINRSTFKIYYYGNPKKLTMELAKFGYLLKNDQLHWSIYKNE